MDTQQFLITDTPPSIPVPEKALKINLKMFTPRAIQAEADFTGTHTEVINTLSVFFPKSSSILDAQEIQKLTQFIKRLKKHSFGPVSVTGYTCRLGSGEYNQKLALKRAVTVANAIKKQGIRIGSVTGKAGCCYISDTDPAQNRRVEITVLPPVKQQPSKKEHPEGGD
jgi:outer membrane protein OmpA-like peptidoglycan-associated protein